MPDKKQKIKIRADGVVEWSGTFGPGEIDIIREEAAPEPKEEKDKDKGPKEPNGPKQPDPDIPPPPVEPTPPVVVLPPAPEPLPVPAPTPTPAPTLRRQIELGVVGHLATSGLTTPFDEKTQRFRTSDPYRLFVEGVGEVPVAIVVTGTHPETGQIGGARILTRAEYLPESARQALYTRAVFEVGVPSAFPPADLTPPAAPAPQPTPEPVPQPDPVVPDPPSPEPVPEPALPDIVGLTLGAQGTQGVTYSASVPAGFLGQGKPYRFLVDGREVTPLMQVLQAGTDGWVNTAFVTFKAEDVAGAASVALDDQAPTGQVPPVITPPVVVAPTPQPTPTPPVQQPEPYTIPYRESSAVRHKYTAVLEDHRLFPATLRRVTVGGIEVAAKVTLQNLLADGSASSVRVELLRADNPVAPERVMLELGIAATLPEPVIPEFEEPVEPTQPPEVVTPTPSWPGRNRRPGVVASKLPLVIPGKKVVRPRGRLFYDMEAAAERDLFPMHEYALTVPLPTPSLVMDSTPPVMEGHLATIFPVRTIGEWYDAVKAAYANGGGIIELASRDVVLEDVEFHAPPQEYDGQIVVRTKLLAEAARRMPKHGRRVSRLFAREHFATFSSPLYNNGYALRIKRGCRNIWFEGVNILQKEEQWGTWGLVHPEPDTQNIFFSHCCVTPNSDEERTCIRGFYWESDSGGIIDSYIGQFRAGSRDAQAVLLASAKLAFKIVNNYLSGSGESFMIAGTQPFRHRETEDYYPRNVEYRLNHSHHPMRWNPRNVAYRDAGKVLKAGLVVKDTVFHGQPRLSVGTHGGYSSQGGDYGLGGFDINLDEGHAFDTTQTAHWDDFGSSYRVYAVCVEGQGKGGWAEVKHYNSDTQVYLDTDQVGYWPGGVLPGPGSVIEIRRRAKIRSKNLWECKSLREAGIVTESIFEDHWHGEDTQPYAIVPKVDGPDGSGNFCRSENLCITDIAIVGVLNGLGVAGYGQDKRRGNTHYVDGVYVDNVLHISTQSPWGGPRPLSLNAPGITIDRWTTYNETPYAAAIFNDEGAERDMRVTRSILPMGDYALLPAIWPAKNAFYSRTTPDRLWQDNGICNTGGDTRRLDPDHWPQQGNDPARPETPHRTLMVQENLRWPIKSGDWTQADWTPSEFQGVTLSDGTTGNLGHNQAELWAAIAGVREDVPFEWQRS